MANVSSSNTTTLYSTTQDVPITPGTPVATGTVNDTNFTTLYGQVNTSPTAQNNQTVNNLLVTGSAQINQNLTVLGSTTLNNTVINGMTWPLADGTNGQVLTTDGSGNLYWSSIGSLISYTLDASAAVGGADLNLTDNLSVVQTVLYSEGTGVTITVPTSSEIEIAIGQDVATSANVIFNDIDLTGRLSQEGEFIYVNDDNTATDSGYYFNTTENFRWENGNQRFALSDDLLVNGYVWAQGNNLYADSDLYLNYDNANADVIINFGLNPSGNETLKWQSTLGRFELSNDLYVDGYVWAKNNNIYSDADLYTNYDNSNNDSGVYFGTPTSTVYETLLWERNLGNSRFVFSDPLRIQGTTYSEGDLYSDSDLYLNNDNANVNVSILFGINPTGYETLIWNVANQQFEFSDQLYVTEDLYVGGDKFQVNALNNPIDSYVYFNNTEYIKWDNAAGEFVITDDVDIQGNIHVGGDLEVDDNLYLNYDQDNADVSIFFGTPTSTTDKTFRYDVSSSGFYMNDALLVDGNLLSSDDIYINYDHDNVDSILYFGLPTTGFETLSYEPAQSHFEFSAELLVQGNIKADTNVYINHNQTAADVNIYFGTTVSPTDKNFRYDVSSSGFYMNDSLRVEGNVVADDNLYLNYDQDNSDVFVYFGTTGSTTAESLKWDITDARFEFTDNLYVNGYLNATGDFLGNADLYLNYDQGNTDVSIFFGTPTSTTDKTFRYDVSSNGFYMNDALRVDGNLVADDNLYLNFDQDNTDVFVYFGTSGSTTAESLKWDVADARFEFTDDLYLEDDLIVNGGDITTTQTTFNLINTTATTVNIAGAGTTVSIGASTGTTTINNDLVIGGSITFDYTNYLDNRLSTTSTSTVTLDSWATATYQSANYSITVKDTVSGDVQVTRIDLFHAAGTAYLNQFSNMTSASDLATFAATISGADAVLQITPVSTNNTQFTFSRLATEV